MREVQQALQNCGIPVYPNAWRATAEHKTPPATYMVYTTRLFESEHWDDTPIRYTVMVYLNLWTSLDPTDDVLTVRAAMRNAGFGMDEEDTSFDTVTEQTLVAWTWRIQLTTEVAPDGA